jgi:hypothetical protein
MITILLLASSPSDQTPLELYKEIYEIDQALKGSPFGDHFKFEPKVAVKRSDLYHLIDRYKPDIVHFSAHGNKSSAIYLEDDRGKSSLVPPEVMKHIFRECGKSVKCVIFNSCYLDIQANVIAETINGAVIGMTDEIVDKTAIDFSKEFYRQLANGKDLFKAYQAGKTHIDNSDRLIRIYHPNVLPSGIKFVKRLHFIIQLLLILLLVVLVPLLSMYGFAQVFYMFEKTIDQQREATLILFVAVIAGELGLFCGIAWNRLRSILLYWQ